MGGKWISTLHKKGRRYYGRQQKSNLLYVRQNKVAG